MQGRGAAIAAVVLAVVASGCGEDDEKTGAITVKPPAVRCTPQPAGERGGVAIRPKWSAGDTRRVTIERTREDNGGEAPIGGATTAEVEVLKASRGGAELRWVTGDMELLLGDRELPDEVLDELKKAMSDITVEYSTDRDGAFRKVENLPEMRSQLETMLSTLERLGGDDPGFAQAMQATRQVMESDAFIETAGIEQPGLLHSAYGIELSQGEALTGETELPNPLGGPPIPATSEFELVSARDANGCVAVSGHVDAEPEALRKYLVEGMERLSGREIPEAEIQGMRLRQEIEYAYDPGSGWIARAEARKLVSVADRRRTDRTVLTTSP